MMNYGLGNAMMGQSQRDGAPQMQGGMGSMMQPNVPQQMMAQQEQQPAQGGQGGLGQILQMLMGGGGGMKMPLFANGLPGQLLGKQGIPMGVLGLLGRQLGK